MAGGRRRGAKGAKTKSELNLGDLVLAKVKGHPAWPAKIGRPEDWDKTPDPKKCFVHFFGTDEIAFVAPADIQEFTSETKNKLAARCKGKTVKYFVTAVREICAAFEELQDKSSSGIGADTDVDELHRDRVQKVTEDHNCELDKCSHRHGEMDYQDIKSDISKKNKIFKEGANYTNKDKLPASSPGNLIGPKKEPMSNDSSKEDTVVPSKPSKMMTGTEGGSKDNSYSEAKGHSSGGGVQDGSSPPPSSVHPKYLDSGLKESINGHKSKKIISGSRRQLQDDAQVQKVNSSGAVRSSLPIVSGGNVDINISGEGGVQNRSGSIGGISHSSPNKSRSNMDAPKDQNKKQSLKDKVHLKRAEDLPDSKGTFRKLEAGDLTGETKSHLGHGKHKLATDEVSHHAKSFKSADIDMTKGSVQKTRKSGHLENKAGSAEFKRSVLQGNAEDCLVPRDEDVLPPAKRLRQAPEIVVSSSTRMFDNKLGKASVHRNDLLSSDKAKSPVGQYPKKRRAVRLYDDDDDKPKTPVHGGSIFKGDAPSRILGPVKNGSAHSGKASDTLDDGGSSKVSLPTVKRLNESLPSISYKHSEVGKRRQSSNSHIFTSPVKSEFAKRSSEEVRPVRVSPVRSPLPASTVRPVLESPKPNIPLVKVSDNTVHQNSQAGLDKNMAVVPDSLDRTINQGILERNKSIPSVDRKKDASKLSSRASDSVLLTEKTLDVLFSDGDRVEKDKEASREDKTFLPSDLKSEDSALSMKHLIAVAQAKRKEAHSQSFSHGDSFLDVSGGSPSFMFAVPPVQPSSSIQADIQGSYSYSSSTSPASHIRKPSLDNNHDIENFDDRRIGSGHRAVGDPLSGSTEAAVARDAFEGMIETLSRTKESIGRATRLAIDCAKHGIANEVVELLIHKLETESSLHRKIDLFFLVDSITQCSHSQKGIAGASYIPIVQASLPRLLGAAAPPGTGARENRRQCLKVLRLWFERKTLPESILRRYMDDIGASNNDDISAGSFLRRPSRAERAVDDPIREMEGMLVDEYGSNATFQLPGFVTSHVFDEEEEEEEELQITQNLCKERADRSPPERNTPVEEAEKFSITPSDRRHCVLEDVDGELEMEDVSVHQKDEKVLTVDAPLETVPKEQGLNRTFDAGLSSSEQFPFPVGSPPSPPGSPPPTPPLPDSPIPVSLPPPPPSSPSPPPPPPPPLPPQVQSHPTPPAGMLPSVIPHPSVLPPLPVLPQHLHSIQSSAPSSSSNLAYQRQDAQLPQLAGNNPHAAHLDVNSRNEMYPQPHPYTNPQAPQPSQQFQTVPLSQRSFHPAPPPQVPSSHFSYSNPIVQQRPQHPYPQPYKLPSHPDAPRQYHTDDKWRMQANEFSTNNQHGPWMNGVRSSLLPVPSYGHEGYFRPPMDRLPPPIPTSFQQSAVNAIPAGPPIAGHVGPQMMPPRPDLSSLGPWKPT